MVLFASSNCCLRWAICADMNPPSLGVAWALFPAATLPASVPLASRVCWSLARGVTRFDPLGFFPGVVVGAAALV